MIKSRTDYLAYLEADRIALGRERLRLSGRLRHFLAPDYTWKFQRLLRKAEYYKNVKRAGVGHKVASVFWKVQFRRFSVKLGFSIPENVFGPGLAIVHYGTIVVNQNARIGANCRIHVCTNIGASGGGSKAPRIGDNVYLAPGVKIFGDITIASNIAIGANSVVNKSFNEENVLIAGSPARVIGPINIKEIIRHI